MLQQLQLLLLELQPLGNCWLLPLQWHMALTRCQANVCSRNTSLLLLLLQPLLWMLLLLLQRKSCKVTGLRTHCCHLQNVINLIKQASTNMQRTCCCMLIAGCCMPIGMPRATPREGATAYGGMGTP